MVWYQYLMCFFGGALIANFFPHFVRGITGTKFPTPFAKPPGRGLSPAPVNVLWALVNLVAGFFLLRAGGFSLAFDAALITSFLGFATMSLMMSNVFSQRMQQ